MLNLSEDAVAACDTFKSNPFVVLTFNTPSRIDPRMEKALIDLIAAGVITREVNGPKWQYKVLNRPLLDQVPRISLADHKRIGLNFTKD